LRCRLGHHFDIVSVNINASPRGTRLVAYEDRSACSNIMPYDVMFTLRSITFFQL